MPQPYLQSLRHQTRRLARYARNRRLGDALFLQAYSALRASPGARTYYDQHATAAPPTTKLFGHWRTRLVGILHGCIRHHTVYDEHHAWHTADQEIHAAA